MKLVFVESELLGFVGRSYVYMMLIVNGVYHTIYTSVRRQFVRSCAASRVAERSLSAVGPSGMRVSLLTFSTSEHSQSSCLMCTSPSFHNIVHSSSRSSLHRAIPSTVHTQASMPLSHKLISPSQHACVKPSCSTKFLHLSPPLSFFFIYLNNFCRLCTNSLRFLLLTLSFLPLVSKKSASTLILAVRIAICTSLLPVSGPALGVAFEAFSPLASASYADGFGVRCVSVLWRPNVEIQR
jgi:hypothetical protein